MKVLVATSKPFAPVAVKGIKEIVEALNCWSYCEKRHRRQGGDGRCQGIEGGG